MSMIRRKIKIENLFSNKNQNNINYLNKNTDINTGIFGQGSHEPSVNRIKAEYETITNGSHNTFIVLGRDRPNSLASGYGNKGATSCGAIDIVVGMGVAGRQTDDNNEPFFVNPNFKSDAARIYISQMTDIDDNFYIKSNKKSKAKSAIGIKADDIRIIGREKIKLVTGTDKYNSQNSDIESQFGGIELIAGNSEDELQPLVLGDNLKEYLIHLNNKLDTFYNVFFNFYKSQSDFNQQVAEHTHHSPFFGIPTLLNPNLYISDTMRSVENYINIDLATLFFKNNMSSMENKYLLSMASNKYILSPRNKTN